MTSSLVPCVLCGTRTEPNDSYMCLECLRGQISITDSIDRKGEMVQCSECFRWLIRSDGSSKHRNSNELWQAHEPESNSLLGVCLKKIRGLQNKDIRVVEANFIWTEPHSRRIKVGLVVEAEVLNGKTKVKQKVEVEFIHRMKKCMNCVKEASEHSWEALVQVRQRTTGSKAIIALEEMIVKAGLGALLNSVQITKEGLDLYCHNKNQGETVVAFVTSHMPCKVKTSKKQVSKLTAEYVFVVEVAPVCKYDFVPITTKSGKIQELMLVAKLSSSVHLINPMSCRKMEIKADKFFMNPLQSLMTASDLVEFIVLDVQEEHKGPVVSDKGVEIDKYTGGFVTAHIEVARATDFGINDSTYIVRSHLGNILKAGDPVLGYDLVHSMVQGNLRERLNFDMQDVVLVRKSSLNKAEKKKELSSSNSGVAMHGDSGEGIEEIKDSTIFTSVDFTTLPNLEREWTYVDEEDRDENDNYISDIV